MSRWLIASSATEVLACGSTLNDRRRGLNDRRRGRAEQFWQDAHATRNSAKARSHFSRSGTVAGAVWQSVMSRQERVEDGDLSVGHNLDWLADGRYEDRLSLRQGE